MLTRQSRVESEKFQHEIKVEMNKKIKKYFHSQAHEKKNPSDKLLQVQSYFKHCGGATIVDTRENEK